MESNLSFQKKIETFLSEKLKNYLIKSIIAIIAILFVITFTMKTKEGVYKKQANEFKKFQKAKNDTVKIEEFIKTSKFDPVRQQALIKVAGIYFKNKKFANAIETYKKFTDEYPNSTFLGVASMGLAKCFQQGAKYKEAQELFEKIAETYDDLAPEAYFLAATSAKEQKKIQEAKNLFEKVIATGIENMYSEVANQELSTIK